MQDTRHYLAVYCQAKINVLLGMLARLPWARRRYVKFQWMENTEEFYVECVSLIVSCYSHYRRKEIVSRKALLKNIFRGHKYSQARFDIFQKSGGTSPLPPPPPPQFLRHCYLDKSIHYCMTVKDNMMKIN